MNQMVMVVGRVLILVLGGIVVACSGRTGPPLAVAPRVELERYLGTWYDIAHIPHRFQKGCFATTATYSLRDDGDIAVVNRCQKDALDGPEESAEGKAWVVDKESNAKLKVQFFWPFRGDYWILEIADDYSHAVVGHPSRDYLWILSRTPAMAPELYQGILARLEQAHYDLSRLELTLHPATPR